VGREEKGHRT